MKTVKVVELFEKTELLLRENLRVSNSLYKNDKVTKDVVYRAEAELSKILQDKSEAEKNKIMAASYFNFLLNRELDTGINVKEGQEFANDNFTQNDEAENIALKNREELTQLKLAIETADNSIGLSKSKFLPGLSLAVDYGFQGEKYKFTKDDDFWMASVVLQWNLFNGFSDKAKVEQSQWEKKIFETREEELRKQIKLQVRDAYQKLNVSRKTITTAEDRLKSAEKSFEIIEKKYKEGMASQIEFIDSRTTLTQAEINYLVTKYDLQNRMAEFEKVTATFPVAQVNY